MKKIVLPVLMLLAIACTPKPTPNQLENRLKKAMTTFLYENINNDSSKVKFRITDVTYFLRKEAYECEFKVRMIQPGHDTTGIMVASISRDFSKVVRKI